jgi:hypothetical protein
MKRYTLFLGLIAALGFGSLSVNAQAGGGAGGNGHMFGLNKLLCFSGTDDGSIYGGTCTLTRRGAASSALIVTNDGDPDGSYAGVYSNNRWIYGKPLSSIGTLSFRYTGDPALAGSPRFSVPIDTDGDGNTDVWAYISAFYCDNGSGNVSANNTGCTIFTSDGGSYVGVDALTAAYPGATIANDNYVFVISDEPGMWTISNVKFGRPGNGGNGHGNN